MLIGYARVSTTEQDNTLQLDALRRAGVERVFHEKRSGAGVHRRQLEQLLDQLHPGDVLTVYKVDRLAGDRPGRKTPPCHQAHHPEARWGETLRFDSSRRLAHDGCAVTRSTT